MILEERFSIGRGLAHGLLFLSNRSSKIVVDLHKLLAADSFDSRNNFRVVRLARSRFLGDSLFLCCFVGEGSVDGVSGSVS